LGYDNTYISQSGIKALKIIEEKHLDLILADVIVECMITGIELAKQAKNYNIPLIFVTNNSDEKTVNKAEFTESYDFITKPFKVEELKYKFR